MPRRIPFQAQTPSPLIDPAPLPEEQEKIDPILIPFST
jgi:hypothetical protein